MIEKKLDPVHPGEVLLEEFLEPMGLSQNRLGLDIGVHPRRINEIVLGKRRITADTALRLARYFGNSPQFWLGLQTDYDLDVPSDKLKLTKGFDIVEGETTTLTLDFDAKESIKESGKDGYKLNPTIKIIQE